MTETSSNTRPPYQLLERIGRGSFGQVFKALQQQSGQLAAVKVLDLEASDDDLEEIQKEIRLLSVCDSDFITKYHGSYLVDMKLWIVMDYAGGGSIRHLMKAGVIPERLIGPVTRDVCDALAYLHKTGIIHRDIKAANILLTEDGRVQLCDFGVAGQVSMSSLRRNSFVGTPYWMAPEVIKRSQYDVKADIWSLGITVYEMAKGNPPFADQDPMRALFLIPRSPPSQLEGDFSKVLQEFVSICLNDDPQLRPSAEDLFKTRFLKQYSKRKSGELVELIQRYREWKVSHGDDDSDLEDEKVFDLEQDLAETEDWVFDTARTKRSILSNSGNMDTIQASKHKTGTSESPDTEVEKSEMLDMGTIKASRSGQNSPTVSPKSPRNSPVEPVPIHPKPLVEFQSGRRISSYSSNETDVSSSHSVDSGPIEPADKLLKSRSASQSSEVNLLMSAIIPENSASITSECQSSTAQSLVEAFDTELRLQDSAGTPSSTSSRKVSGTGSTDVEDNEPLVNSILKQANNKNIRSSPLSSAGSSSHRHPPTKPSPVINQGTPARLSLQNPVSNSSSPSAQRQKYTAISSHISYPLSSANSTISAGSSGPTSAQHHPHSSPVAQAGIRLRPPRVDKIGLNDARALECLVGVLDESWHLIEQMQKLCRSAAISAGSLSNSNHGSHQ